MTARVLSWTSCVLLAAFVVFCLAWRLEGGRWERVESPSMGTTSHIARP